MANESSTTINETILTRCFKEGRLEKLEQYINDILESKSLDTGLLIGLAKLDKQAAGFVRKSIDLHGIDENELADKIAKTIIYDINKHVEEHLRKYNKYTLNPTHPIPSDVDDSMAEFFCLISLIRDVSVLGRKLIEASPQFESLVSPPTSPSSISLDKRSLLSQKTKSSKSICGEDATSEDLLAALIESSSTDDFLVLTSSLDSISLKDMILAALILIKSHECFTLSHDIQGVVMVLRRTKFMIINILAPKNQMELITKLLTSIGRYNEMNYVFDLFKERNQFEVLLSKGVEKTPELQIALFNYVKKNPEFYPLVTLNFRMFREIAESFESSAMKRLDKLIQARKKTNMIKKTSLVERSDGRDHHRLASMASRKLSLTVASSSTLGPSTLAPSNNDKNFSSNSKPLYSKDGLNLCLVELVDASDCFSKAGCYKRSNNCEYKAKLVALQLALLPSDINVLNLQQSQLNDLIMSFESFSEAHIVAQAYDYHVNWRQVLFEHVILNTDELASRNYLTDFSNKCDLATGLITGLVLLYKQHLANSHLSQADNHRLANSMKMVLALLPDVELRCKIYTQLSFQDAKDELLKNEAIEAHLKDLKLV